MGNSTVSPANSRAPVIPINSTDHRTSVYSFYPDVSTDPTKSSTPRVSYNSTAENVSFIPPVPITSPTFAFPVTYPTIPTTATSPISAIPIEHPTAPISVEHPTAPISVEHPTAPISVEHPTAPISVEHPIDTIPIEHPIAATPNESPHPIVPAESPTATIPIEHPIVTTPTESPNAIVRVESPIATVPVNSPTPEIPIVATTTVVPIESPTPEVPAFSSIPTNSPISAIPTTVVPVNTPIPSAPVASFSPDMRTPSPTANINGFPVISPDTSAVSPTLDLPKSPITSPVPTHVVIPVKPIVASPEHRPAVRMVHDAATSPMVSVVPNTPAISKTSRPTKVDRKRKNTKKPVPPAPALTVKEVKHFTLSSDDRFSKWNEFEQKQQEEQQKRLTYSIQRSQSSSKSIISSSKSNDTDLKITPIDPNIVAVPSFSLRSTAVCNPSQDQRILSERTQSIHNDLSIFKYYVTYNEPAYLTGDHTKATMFKMDTHLKKTPLPIPSLSVLTKNFSDGTHKTNDNICIGPSFGSLGLQHNLETEPSNPSSKELRLHEKQRQRKLRESAFLPNDTSDSNNSLQFVHSTILSQPDFSTVDRALNHQPLTSILKKKSTSQFQKNDFEDNPSIVSFNVPTSSPSIRKKASQSISRSEKLIRRKKN